MNSKVPATEHEPCPRCGKQPIVSKGKSYWTAHCETSHFPRKVEATPMKTKHQALAAWDEDVKNDRI
jgi:hypothetical protein